MKADQGINRMIPENSPQALQMPSHVDLYDRVELIPFDKLTSFFTENLK